MEQENIPWRDRRPGALGGLRVLTDELLCAVIELLDFADVGRLACVSSVMYILCNEEPVWMKLCLKIGGLLEYMGSWKRTLLHRQNIHEEIGISYTKPMQFDGFNSLFLYRRWYRCFTALDTFSFDQGDLERKKNLSLNQFIHEFDGRKPVLLTDLANMWQAKTKWAMPDLLSRYGDIVFRISQRTSAKISMKLKDYASYIDIQHDEEPLYIFDDKFGESAPSLLKDYNTPHIFQDDFFEVLENDKRPPFRWLIIGPERSGASWHVDPSLTSAWNTLLQGRKRWALYPPGRVPDGVTVHVNDEDGDINIEGPSSLQWWLDVYPLLSDYEKPLECTQLPGETIYVPTGWWHCVLNLETTIAVTQNFVNASNFEFVCLDMAPGHRHRGVCRAGLLAISDSACEYLRKDEIMNLQNGSKLTRKEKRLKICSNSIIGQPEFSKILQNQEFSYSIDFLVMFLEGRDHYTSAWSPANCIGPREMREWLHKLWVVKPELRHLIWKGACIALNADKWFACAMEICAFHDLPPPSVDEKLPVGAGSNPVFLFSNFVLKIYVEGGLEYAVNALATELEFFRLVQKENSPLVDHIPEVVASGFAVNNNGVWQTFPWDGKRLPDTISACALNGWDATDDCFSFGVWSKKIVELDNEKVKSSKAEGVWPYMVTKRFQGDMLATLREVLNAEEILNVASFLGERLRNLHLLPVPGVHYDVKIGKKSALTISTLNGYDEIFKRYSTAMGNLSISPSPGWELIIADLKKRQKDVSNRLTQWGDPIPRFLIDKVEEYLPKDLSLLIKDEDGLYRLFDHPTWIHSDIMDDNILIEQCHSGTSSISNKKLDSNTVMEHAEKREKLHLLHLLDFSDLSLGDPLCDLIPIYIDVFRGDPRLLNKLLESYKLPLKKPAKETCSRVSSAQLSKYRRVSYRAMCYCILHMENILGAVFSLWRDLKFAKSWEEVEESVWGLLNHYQCT